MADEETKTQLTEYAKEVIREHPLEVGYLLEGIGISEIRTLFGSHLSLELVSMLIITHQRKLNG